MRRPTGCRANCGKNLQTQCLAEKYRETKQFLAQVRLRLGQQKTPENLTQHFKEGLRDSFARDARLIGLKVREKEWRCFSDTPLHRK